ncbi:MAG: type topoisomerase, partial [Actinomycetota bacterium]
GEPTGLITYMRTDSLNLSAQSLTEIGAFVRDTYGERYTIDEPRRFATTAKGAQEAHEAIRPTSIERTPERIRRYLTNEQARLYEVIWQRTVATQMAPAVFDRVSVDVVGSDAGGELVFRVSGQVERFDGYLRAYREARDEDDTADDESESRLPDLTEGQALTLASIQPERHETSPPPRFSERTLVEVLEELGIGRPSTYASIISTLEQRDYVIKESRRFFPTALGEVVVAFLKVHFPEIVDVNFTARMEETLDEIASGEAVWGRTVTAFLDEVDEWVRERKPERPRLPLKVPTDCHLCGAPMERVFSGKSKSWFASCSRWPDCDGTLPLEADGTVGEPEAEAEPDERVRCPKCDQPMLLRSGRYGRFYSCVDYPGCKGIRGLQQRLMYRDEDGVVRPFRSPTDPNVFMELRTSRYGKPFVGSTGYPDDVFAVWSLPLASPCPECGAPLRQPPRNRREPIAVCAHPVEQHVFALEDFELPTVATWTVVDGVAPFDPELGGEPIAVEEPPMPIELTLIGTQAPPAKRPGRGRFASKDGADGADGAEGGDGANGGERAAKKAPAKKAPAKKRPAKKAPAKKAPAKKRAAKAAAAKGRTAKEATATGGGVGGTGRQPAVRKAAARKAAATAKKGRGGARGAGSDAAIA